MNQHVNSGDIKRIAIITDEKSRKDLIEWSYTHRNILNKHQLFAAPETAEILGGTINTQVHALDAVPVTFHRQLAQMIRESSLDIIIFLGDANAAGILDSGAQQVMQLAQEHGIATASGVATASLVTQSIAVTEKAPSTYDTLINIIRENVILMGYGWRKAV